VTFFRVTASTYYKISISLFAALIRELRKFDIVHVHSLYQFPSTAAALCCRMFAIPYVLRPHGTLDPFLYRRHRPRKWIYEVLVERRNIGRAAAVHFTTNEEMTLAATLGIRFRGVVVQLGVRGHAGSSESFNSKWPQTRNRKTILFLGRLNFKKGLDLLARAFGELCRERDDVHLFLAGPDNDGYGSKVRDWLAEEGVLDRCTFAGMLTGEDKWDALAGADLFVLPSYSENFGLALGEAMACGLPVVISNRVNIWHEVAEARAGLVVNCEVNELRAAMSALLDDSAEGRRMGEAGRRLVAERFTWAAVGEKLRELYQQLVASAPGSSACVKPYEPSTLFGNCNLVDSQPTCQGLLSDARRHDH
jgi:glycosyltransferase involved in cell wall biosynthesis